MKTGNLIKTALALSLVSMMFIGCSSDSTTSSTPTSTAASGVLVDPYIVGSVLCEDLNASGTCDTGEQVSTATNSAGSFTFANALTAGSHIIIKTQGLHEGKTYDVDIAGVVSSSKTIDVVSPLTTFEAKGLTTAQFAEMLNKAATEAGISGWTITAANILADPLSGGLGDKKVSNLNNTELVNIQASLATYGLLKIMNGSTTLKALSGTELYNSGMGLNGHTEVLNIAKAMLKNMTDYLNTTILTQVKTGIDNGRTLMVNGGLPSATATSALPEPTTNLVIKVAVTLIDRFAEIGYTTCNATSGDSATKVTAALLEVLNQSTAITSKAEALAFRLYGLTYHSNLATIIAIDSTILDSQSDIKAGYTAGAAGLKTVRFDSSNNLVQQ